MHYLTALTKLLPTTSHQKWPGQYGQPACPLAFGIKLVLLFLLSGTPAQAQQKYWIARDTTLTSTIKNILPEPENCSEWLGLCSYRLEDPSRRMLADHGILCIPVKYYSELDVSTDETTLGFALEQVEASVFQNKGLTGKGVKIGIIDGGFLKADSEPSLKHFFERGLVKSYTDYITPKMNPYDGSASLDDGHGTEVWQLIGGYNTDKNILYGLATEAEYYLARTDHGGFEKRIEEDYLIRALEDMHRQGVKLVNISLGYNVGFTDPSENYTPSDMDGQTTFLAKAVEIAALEKGMLIVVAAGNEGSDSWGTLSTPGDAEHALTVGASKFKVWDKMDYSSTGPEFTGFVKPDIVVYSASGTSYSTPIVTGMAACMWQMDTTLTNLDIIRLLRTAGNFHPYPNNYLGHGVPTFSRIWQLMQGNTLPQPQKLETTKNTVTIRQKFEASYLVAYHKRDDRNVINRVVYHPLGHKVKIRRPKEARRTSLLAGKEVIEIFWK